MVLSTNFYKIAKSILKKRTNLTHEEKIMLKEKIVLRNILINIIGIVLGAFVGAVGIFYFIVGIFATN